MCMATFALALALFFFRYQRGVGSLLAIAVFDRCLETPLREACGNVFAAIVFWGHTDTAQSG